MKTNVFKFLEMLFGITILCAGATMGIIAGLGQTTSTGTCSALADAIGIKVGTSMAIVYSFFLILQLSLLRKSFRAIRMLQLIPAVLQGIIMNYFRYSFPPFQWINPENYGSRFLIFAIGTVLISLGFTCVKCSDFINYPPEAFCSLVSDRTGIRFGTCKIFLDFAYVAVSLLLCFIYNLDFGIVREGTLIFAVCNGMLINLFMPRIQKIFIRLDGRQE